MITQTFLIGKEVYTIIIKGKKVFWKDRKMPTPIQMIPIDKRVQRAILTSRNRIDKRITEQFSLNKEEQKEYDLALKEEDFEQRLAEICKKDAISQRSKLIKEEKL